MSDTITHRSAKLTFLSHERQTPSEAVHKVGQPVRMRRAVELANVHYVVFVLQYRCFATSGVHDEYDQVSKSAITYLLYTSR